MAEALESEGDVVELTGVGGVIEEAVEEGDGGGVTDAAEVVKDTVVEGGVDVKEGLHGLDGVFEFKVTGVFDGEFDDGVWGGLCGVGL